MTRFTKIILGQKYNMLTALSMVKREGVGNLYVRCKCDCGNETTVLATRLYLGKTKSCGCLKGPGYRKTITYKSWLSAKMRCSNEKDRKHYKDYGERGIKMCDRWANSFENFLLDMGERPSSVYTLDRIDVNGDYCPENCRWATKKEQGNNRRNNHFVEYKGEKLTATEFSERYGIDRGRVFYGFRLGLEAEEIILKFRDMPKRAHNRNH